MTNKHYYRDCLITAAKDRRVFELRHSNEMWSKLEWYINNILASEKIENYELLIYSDGFYLGETRNGMRNGYGAYLWWIEDENNDFYIGYWQNDNFHGEGFYCYENSNSYYGEFNNNTSNGWGYHADISGLVFLADYKNNEIVNVRSSNKDFSYGSKKYNKTTGKTENNQSGSSCCLGTLITIAIIWCFFYFCGNSSNDSHSFKEETTTYVCTAKSSLKVRSSPTTTSLQIGSIKSGEEIEVYSISNDFAKINYNGETGYASSKYLRKK